MCNYLREEQSLANMSSDLVKTDLASSGKLAKRLAVSVGLTSAAAKNAIEKVFVLSIAFNLVNKSFFNKLIYLHFVH